MADYIRKTGDTEHTFTATLTDQNGPADIPVGSTVAFSASKPGASAPVLSGTAQIAAPGALVGDPNRGVVSYPIPASIPSGIYQVNWTVTLSGGAQQTFPEDGYSVLVVLDRA